MDEYLLIGRVVKAPEDTPGNYLAAIWVTGPGQSGRFVNPVESKVAGEEWIVNQFSEYHSKNKGDTD